MSGLDIVISAIVLIGLWRGYSAGAVKTVLSLIAWVVALIVASKLASEFTPLFAPISQNPTLQLAMAFLAMVLVVLLGLGLLSYLIAKTLKAVKLSFLDKLAGGIVGAVLGLIKVLFVLAVISPILIKTEMYQNSPLAQSLLPFAPLAKELVADVADEVWDEINEPN